MPPNPPTPSAPRFVPTLTEVVGRPATDSPASPVSVPAASAGLAQAHAADAADAADAPHLSPATAEALQEQITQRVLARVDADLAGRLSDAIALVVLEQTRFMLPRLREEIAASVRGAVSAALAQERADL